MNTVGKIFLACVFATFTLINVLECKQDHIQVKWLSPPQPQTTTALSAPLNITQLAMTIATSIAAALPAPAAPVISAPPPPPPPPPPPLDIAALAMAIAKSVQQQHAVVVAPAAPAPPERIVAVVDTNTWYDGTLPRLQRVAAEFARIDREVSAKKLGIEGHSGNLPQQTALYSYTATRATHVCETGVNAGHSASNFLLSNARLQYTGFTMDLPAARLADAHFAVAYPNRTHIVFGNTMQTLGDNAALMASTCDVVIVDGGHYAYVSRNDLCRLCSYARSVHTLIMDDVGCSPRYCTEPTNTWHAAVAHNFIHQMGCWGSPDGKRGFCWGVYNDVATCTPRAANETCVAF